MIDKREALSRMKQNYELEFTSPAGKKK